MTPTVISRTDESYPRSLSARLGKLAPQHLTAIGNIDLLALPKTALLCSARAPGHAILAAHDQAARWRDEGDCVISGFHSPVEKECLQILLRGRQPVIICLARGLEGMRVPGGWKKPLVDNRLLVISIFSALERRVTKDLAKERNRLVAALANDVSFAHIAPGGHLDDLQKLLTCWSIPNRMLTDASTLKVAGP